MDLGLDLDKGPNGEGAAADRYAVFYRNGDFPSCGTLKYLHPLCFISNRPHNFSNFDSVAYDSCLFFKNVILQYMIFTLVEF